MIRVLHLVGSPVDDLYADLSRLYASDCLAATADPARYEPVIAYVGPGGEWRFPVGLEAECIAEAEPVRFADAVPRLADLAVDLAVPQMFCRPGMTSYRALLDLLGIPFLGNPASVMAVGADKRLARAAVAAGGVTVPPAEVCLPGDRPALDLPIVVKPADADNSLGVSLVRTDDALSPALDAALAHSDAALVERYIEAGREVRCGTIEWDGGLVALPLEEYDVSTNGIRGVADKLHRDPSGQLHLVAKDPSRAWIVDRADPLSEVVGAAARACHRALGCRHYGLFDFRIDPEGRPWFLEAGLYCSFASQSVIPTMAEASGITVSDLFTGFVHQTLGSGSDVRQRP